MISQFRMVDRRCAMIMVVIFLCCRILSRASWTTSSDSTSVHHPRVSKANGNPVSFNLPRALVASSRTSIFGSETSTLAGHSERRYIVRKWSWSIGTP